MRILPLLRLTESITSYRVATYQGQPIPASLRPGGKGHRSTLPPSPQGTFKDEIGTVKVSRSWLQARLSSVNWSVLVPLQQTGLQKKAQPGNSIFSSRSWPITSILTLGWDAFMPYRQIAPTP